MQLTFAISRLQRQLIMLAVLLSLVRFSSVVDVAHDIESMRFHLSSGVLAVFGSQRYVLLLWTPYALVIRCSNSRTPIRLN
jgi:hypothetical protein